MKVIYSNSPKMTEEAGFEFAKELKKGDVVALFGDLGAGKTSFVRGIAKAITPDADVTSPTFTIMQEYEGNPPIYHFDMYRIDSFEDLYNTGFFDYMESGGICIIEWSEKILYALENYIKVTIEKTNKENERIIKIEKVMGGQR